MLLDVLLLLLLSAVAALATVITISTTTTTTTTAAGVCCSRRGLECRLIHRYDFHKSLINWADIIFTAGGDGTFLMVASNIPDCSKPVVGINTDPLR